MELPWWMGSGALQAAGVHQASLCIYWPFFCLFQFYLQVCKLDHELQRARNSSYLCLEPPLPSFLSPHLPCHTSHKCLGIIVVQLLTPVWFFVSPWTVAHQALLSSTVYLPGFAQIHVHVYSRSSVFAELNIVSTWGNFSTRFIVSDELPKLISLLPGVPCISRVTEQTHLHIPMLKHTRMLFYSLIILFILWVTGTGGEENMKRKEWRKKSLILNIAANSINYVVMQLSISFQSY